QVELPQRQGAAEAVLFRDGPLDGQRREVGAGRVDRTGPTRRAGADDDEFFRFFGGLTHGRVGRGALRICSQAWSHSSMTCFDRSKNFFVSGLAFLGGGVRAS